jgi:hypothetical protein
MNSIDQHAAPANEILNSILRSCAPRVPNELQEYLAKVFKISTAKYDEPGDNYLKALYAYCLYKSDTRCYYNSAAVAGISYQYMKYCCERFDTKIDMPLYVEFARSLQLRKSIENLNKI